MWKKIEEAARKAVQEVIEKGNCKKGSLFVVGCSSSEIVGAHIGKGSSLDAAKAVVEGIYPALLKNQIFLAAQCCEHLNRALILEEEAAVRFGYEIVSVVPQPKAGGSFAATAYHTFNKPVAVEHIKAAAGMDIGGTLIGMHLKDVAVPLRISISKIGEASLTCAYTRPKYIGGIRAVYA